MHQAQQFEYLRNPEGPFDELVEDPSRVLEALVVKGARRLLEAPKCPAAGPVAEGPSEQDVSIR